MFLQLCCSYSELLHVVCIYLCVDIEFLIWTTCWFFLSRSDMCVFLHIVHTPPHNKFISGKHKASSKMGKTYKLLRFQTLIIILKIKSLFLIMCLFITTNKNSKPISLLLSNILEWKYYIPDTSVIEVPEQTAQTLPLTMKRKTVGMDFKSKAS